MNLFHRDLGGAGNPPLIILHGLLGSSRNWQTAGRDLAVKYHVFALDLRNHGQSPHADEMTYDVLVADVIAWMAAQGMSRATFVGHSMGGKTAMLLACRQADRVKKLIVVDIAPKDYRWEAHRAEFAAMTELDLGHLASRAEAELRFEARVDDWAMRKFLVTNLERNADDTWGWQINLPALTAALPLLEKNSLGAADRFDGEAKFIIGGRSRYVLPEDASTIRRYFLKAEIETIAESGHNPHMDQRPAFVRAALE